MLFNKNNIDIVLYHGKCHDGFGSAFIIWYYSNYNQNIVYIPCFYLKEDEKLNEDFLNKIKDKNVIMVDFCYNSENMNKIFSVTKSFMVLDHHKTSNEFLSFIPNENKIIDMTKSAVGITWKYFYENDNLPMFLDFIQDKDIWTFKLADTENFCTYFIKENFDFNVWSQYLDTSHVINAINIGKQWLEYQNIIIDNIVKKTFFTIQKFKNKLLLIGYVNSSLYQSEVGNKMMTTFSFIDLAVVWYYDPYRNQTLFSLRSLDNKADVSEIALDQGGGGHRNASGVGYSGSNTLLKLENINDYKFLNMIINADISKNESTMKISKFIDLYKTQMYMDLLHKIFNGKIIISTFLDIPDQTMLKYLIIDDTNIIKEIITNEPLENIKNKL